MIDSDAKALMERHGITTSHETVYRYQEFRYANLADALNYAELNATRADALAVRVANPEWARR